MAYFAETNRSILSGLFEQVAAFFSALCRSAVMSAAAQSRMHQIDALNAKTDEELAAMNLRRADIASYVFRDLMHI